ncbi:rhomboid family intramembrane serine protease [Pontibacter liquoris]|uniref:rhomboid family intramembrane serine protease n=1 Tax=Pontibacter liquoris TaxID=2905677 RepID=UPI001FA7DE94|nr:rhomboid family intramembrane serine protease [Pontibacter liquoris]
MENNFAAVIAGHKTEDLLQVLQEQEEYAPEVVLAILDELEKRGVALPEEAAIRAKAQQAYVGPTEQQPQSAAEKLRDFGMTFVPQQAYFVTPVLLNLNLLAFLLMVLLGISPINPDAASLIAMGANFGPYTLSGEWWRLLTSTFLHGGLLHLAFNMLALVSVGRALEPLIGRWPYLIAYLLCGLAGSITSLWWDPVRAGVGASGAIFGMFGLLLILMLLERKLPWQHKKGMLLNLGFVLVLNLGFGMKSGIDNAAHSGGLVCGLLFGAVLLLRSDRQLSQHYSAKGNAVMAGVGLLLLGMFFKSIPLAGEARFVYAMEEVSKKEAQAMRVFVALYQAGDKAQAADFVPLLDEGIRRWDESIALLAPIDDVVGEEQDKVTVMLKYLRLRKKSYQVLRSDLAAKRTWQSPQQQQLLQAIDHYVRGLRNGKASEIAREDDPLKSQLSMPAIAAERDSAAKPLYVVDGKKVQQPATVAHLRPDDIESIQVLKGTDATTAYGPEGAAGVVQITTKKATR